MVGEVLEDLVHLVTPINQYIEYLVMIVDLLNENCLCCGSEQKEGMSRTC